MDNIYQSLTPEARTLLEDGFRSLALIDSRSNLGCQDSEEVKNETLRLREILSGMAAKTVRVEARVQQVEPLWDYGPTLAHHQGRGGFAEVGPEAALNSRLVLTWEKQGGQAGAFAPGADQAQLPVHLHREQARPSCRYICTGSRPGPAAAGGPQRPRTRGDWPEDWHKFEELKGIQGDVKYRCKYPNCGLVHKKDTARRHWSYKHISQCTICGAMFNKLTPLSAHVVEEHCKGQAKYFCPFCNKVMSFQRDDVFREHIGAHCR
ncbi:hypothetical protein F4809DRAFT_636871 [Biscogniauxia mediterranea]|nr:hypothetical protein F4809DRAFT_636871 [Biscogniauxia mediterranea]